MALVEVERGGMFNIFYAIIAGICTGLWAYVRNFIELWVGSNLGPTNPDLMVSGKNDGLSSNPNNKQDEQDYLISKSNINDKKWWNLNVNPSYNPSTHTHQPSPNDANIRVRTDFRADHNIGSAIRSTLVGGLSIYAIKNLSIGLPPIARAITIGAIAAGGAAAVSAESIMDYRYKHQQLLITDKSHSDLLKIQQKNNRTSSWFGFGSGSGKGGGKPPTPPTRGLSLPIGLGIVLPEHWVNALSSFNDYSSNVLFYLHIWNNLCVLSDCLFIIVAVTTEIYILNKFLMKPIINFLNKILDVKYPKLTKFINIYLVKILNANANLWFIISMVSLIWLSYTSQILHLKLLISFNADMGMDMANPHTSGKFDFTLPFGLTLPDHWVIAIENSNCNNYASFELCLQHHLNNVLVLSECLFILTVITFFLFITNFILNKYIMKHIIRFLNKTLDIIKYPKLTKFINIYLVKFINANVNLWFIICLVSLIWLSYKSQVYHLELLKTITANMHLLKTL